MSLHERCTYHTSSTAGLEKGSARCMGAIMVKVEPTWQAA